jgi:acetylornithine aminotransferase/acetylornithine/N-succinyldiaminopimelate aminotransferase
MNETTPPSDLFSSEDRYQLRTYAKLPISIERGEGCWIFDANGRRFLDFYGGHAVASTGHCHPRVVEALRRQAGELIFYSNVAYSGARARAVRRLIEMAGEPYFQAFLANSGSEANENAIKLARACTGRTEVISLRGSFHGRTYGSLSATGIEKYSAYLNTPVPGHRVLAVVEVSGAVSDNTAAVLVEPVQSLAGVRVLPIPTLAAIRDACRRHGALLIFDEIQTGVGRCGRFLYAGVGGVYPDLVTVAKGIASGFPASAMLATEQIAARVKSGDLGTTFGGGPLACACMEATLQVIAEEGLVENAASLGAYLTQRLDEVPLAKEVRGVGLLIGLRCGGQFGAAKTLQQALFERGILAGGSDDPAILRLMPPLTLSLQEADILVEALASL